MQANVAKLVELACTKGLTIAAAESCTGGMVSAAITDIAGSSSIFKYGFVTYSNDAKQKLLGVNAQTLAQYGAVSEEVVLEMAQGAMQVANADFAVAITGIAGPGGSEFKPEGRVCFAIANAAQATAITKDFGPIGRANVRKKSTQFAISLLQNALPHA